MKNSMKSFIMITFLLLLLTPSSRAHAQSWQKVVDLGFGNHRNDYAWSMDTFKGRLYVGTLNLLGRAEIWRSSSGNENTWEQVYNAHLFSNLGVRNLYADNDEALYATTLHQEGAQILRSTDGIQWTTVVRKGFGNRKNRSIRCLTRFGEYLYAGVGCNGADIYRSKNGLKWDLIETTPDLKSTQVFDPYKDTWVMNNLMIGELAVFKDYLYAFTWTKDVDIQGMKCINRNEQDTNTKNMPPAPGAFEIWRSNDGINWEKVVGQNDIYGNGMGFSLHDPQNLDNDVITSVAVFQDHLYLGTGHDYGKAGIWRTSEGTRWEKVLDFYELGEKFNYYVWRMHPFDNKLFVGTLNLGDATIPGVTGAQIWISETGEAGSFSPLVLNGFDGKSISFTKNLFLPKNCGIRSMSVLNDTLFVGTATIVSVPVSRRGGRFGLHIAGRDSGCEVWKLIP